MNPLWILGIAAGAIAASSSNKSGSESSNAGSGSSGGNNAGMPLLPGIQEHYIRDLNASVRDQFRNLIHRTEALGYSVIITSGYRTFEQQAALYKENPKNAKPGHSYHNFGLALDINVKGPGGALRKASSKADWEASGIPALARSLGFFWGGDYKDYPDHVHFELRPLPMSELVARATAKYGSDPSQVQGNDIALAGPKKKGNQTIIDWLLDLELPYRFTFDENKMELVYKRKITKDEMKSVFNDRTAQIFNQGSDNDKKEQRGKIIGMSNKNRKLVVIFTKEPTSNHEIRLITSWVC